MEPMTMAMIMGGSAAISGGMGMASSSKAAKQQDRAMAQEAAAREKDLAFRQQMYQEEKAFYDPMRQELRSMAMSKDPIGYAKTSSEIKKQYSDALRNITAMGGNSGLAGSAGRQAQFGQAQDLTKAYDEGVQKRLALLQGMGMGGNQLQYGTNVSSGMENMAGMYGNRATMYGNLAASGAAAAGQAISSGMGAIGSAMGGYYGNPNYGIQAQMPSPLPDLSMRPLPPTPNFGDILLPK